MCELEVKSRPENRTNLFCWFVRPWVRRTIQALADTNDSVIKRVFEFQKFLWAHRFLDFGCKFFELVQLT